MSNLALRVEGLSKQYHIGGKQEAYRTIRDTLADAVSMPFRRAGQLLRGHGSAASNLNETIWALKNVSFEVKHGEVVGIIGRNGAGKSTLLKILSRITEPTTGRIEVYGRVGALLEVGTGFHPELTGRENIYLNAAILGMNRKEINRKFDEIVEFAEVEKFIDTPVKHYSSGMGLRLGFAVAAHLEPEILIVDEVLAVGDAAFQKKCLGKMSEVAGEGRTVLFVSHNMAAIGHLCTNAMLLEHGAVTATGGTESVISTYLNNREKYINDVTCSGRFFYGLTANCLPENNQDEVLKPLRPAMFIVSWYSKERVQSPGVYIGVHTSTEELLFGFDNLDFQAGPLVEVNQMITFQFHLDALPLLPDKYLMRLHVKNHGEGYGEVIDRAFEFEVHNGPIHNNSLRELSPRWFGHIVVPSEAEINLGNILPRLSEVSDDTI